MDQHRTMQSFFQPVLSKDNASRSEEPANRLQSSSIPIPVPSEHGIQHGTREATARSNGLGTAEDQPGPRVRTDSIEDVENLGSDPNLDRRKRRKTTPFEGVTTVGSAQDQDNEDEATSGSDAWLTQLREADSSGTTEDQGFESAGQASMKLPETPLGGSPLELAIRKSPMKTPRKPLLAVDVPMATPPTTSRPNTRSSSSTGKDVRSPKPRASSRQKVMKVTNGKLTSSPTSASPVSKRKGKSKDTNISAKTVLGPSKATRIGYGTNASSRRRIGGQIDNILFERDATSLPQPESIEPPKATHPFFMGKQTKSERTDVIVIDDDQSTGHDSRDNERPDHAPPKPKEWNDLGFKKHKTNTVEAVDLLRPLWPPKDLQDLGLNSALPFKQNNARAFTILRKRLKSKKEFYSVADDEDILQGYAASLKHHTDQRHEHFPFPERKGLRGQDMMDTVASNLASSTGLSPSVSALQEAHPGAFERLRCKILADSASPKDSMPGVAQSWLSNSAPLQTNQVLQAQTESLRTWLASHQVHRTANKLSAAQKVKPARKGRRKKKSGELDDFIAASDDEDDPGLNMTKKAVLITGPNGCGKTASVYAVAKELDFEVFEIHPGMRRSAKDIFDKVGDMTQNHLVHKVAQDDGEREATSNETVVDASNGNASVRGSQNAMRSFLGGKTNGTNTVKAAPQTSQKIQSRKQSLILFEEVDILFEEDRAFWTGVIQLIEQSKRPAVLTCNDSTGVPVEDLPLHAILEYDHVRPDLAVDYVLLVAAAEGHWLERDAVHALYLSKGMDLRATISELDFWCQMAVGSQKGGLDWIVDRRSSTEIVNGSEESVRLVSKDTYRTGMGLVPRTLLAPSSSHHRRLLQYAQEELGIPLQSWCSEVYNHGLHQSATEQTHTLPALGLLRQSEKLAETKSVLDLLTEFEETCGGTTHSQPENVSAEVGARLLAANPQAQPISVADTVAAHLQAMTTTAQLTPHAILAAFKPLGQEKAQFPPSTGRLAPSLDTFSSSITIDIAPYVRSIAQYDQRLEEQRDALAGGSQNTKTRRTRASRAALEGGNKASTRDEKWFPKSTIYSALLATGGAWPLWFRESSRSVSNAGTDGTESSTEREAPSPQGDIEMRENA